MTLKIKKYVYTCECGQKFKSNIALENPEDYCPSCNGLMQNIEDQAIAADIIGGTIIGADVFYGDAEEIVILTKSGKIMSFYEDQSDW